MTDIYIGFMSGTSCDGVDASLVETDGKRYFKSIHDVTVPYDSSIRSSLQGLFIKSAPFLELEKQITDVHLKAANLLLAESGYRAEQIKAVGFHGQTILHNAEEKLTWQIGNPHQLAIALGINIVHDFRRRDIALGGQGAPLIPVFHKMLATTDKESPCTIINIGGVSNLTYINQDDLISFDTGPGNALIDDMMMHHFNKKFDNQGKIAKSGSPDRSVVDEILQGEYYQKNYPKSLDRNSFKFFLKKLENHVPKDIIATLTYLTSSSIVQSFDLLPDTPKKIFVCGGGAKNAQILYWLKALFREKDIFTQIFDISKLSDIDSDYVESQGFAYLAARFCEGLPSAFPSTTGATQSNICGCLVSP